MNQNILKTTSLFRNKIEDIIQDVHYYDCKDININTPPFFYFFKFLFHILESYITLKLRPSENIKQYNGVSNVECSICFEPCSITNDKSDCLELQCKHVFHKKCIDNWFIQLYNKDKTCPLCRTII